MADEMEKHQHHWFLMARSNLIEILKRIVEFEESEEAPMYPEGWTWYDVRALPAELMNLHRVGLINITSKCQGRPNQYKLADREYTKKLLKEL